jgi:hypothetical protein
VHPFLQGCREDTVVLPVFRYTIALICLVLVSRPVWAGDAGPRESSDLADWGPLVVNFDKNKTGLDEADKGRIRDLMQQYSLGEKGRVFVVGYTDSSGDQAYNYKLARKRAQVVRTALIKSFGLPAGQVIAIGKGPENPLDSNARKAGRAKNRRAEIYLSNAIQRQLQDYYGRPDPNLEAIDTLLTEARAYMHGDQWDAALQSLVTARTAGADRYGDWHALYGIVGYFKGVPSAQVKAHLKAALDHDPLNSDARDFLSRVEARDNVADGTVNQFMGGTPQEAIAVATMAQQYEYLKLFEATPRYHHQLEHRAMDVWECSNAQGEPVVYYFDYSQVYAWAFSDHTIPAVLESTPVTPKEPHRQKPAAEKKDPVPPPVTPVAVSTNADFHPRTIWESKLFQ